MKNSGEDSRLRARGSGVEIVRDAFCIDPMRRFIREHPVIWNEDNGV